MKLRNYEVDITYLHPSVRCPSAPPYDAEVFSRSDDQKHSEGLSQLSHRMDVQRTDVQGKEGENEQSLTRDRAPQQSERSCFYPCLSQWRITADSQVRQPFVIPT